MDKTEYASLAFDAGFDAGLHIGFQLADHKKPSKPKIKTFAQLERCTRNGDMETDAALSTIEQNII